MALQQDVRGDSAVDTRDRDAAQAADPSSAQHRARVALLMRRARAYHARHPDWVKEFNALTHDAVADGAGGIDYRAMRKWQADHGLRVDGLVGPQSIETARGEQKKDDPKETPKAVEPAPKAEPVGLAPDPEASDIAAEAVAVDVNAVDVKAVDVKASNVVGANVNAAPLEEPKAEVAQTPPGDAAKVVPTSHVRETRQNEVNSKRGPASEFAHAGNGYRKVYTIGKFQALVFLPEQGIVPPKVDVFLFYHGMYTDFSTEGTNSSKGDNPAKAVDLAGSVTASARNVIAIAPMAPNGAGANWEALAGSHKKIVDTVMADLGADLGLEGALTPGNISVAGHSRGGVALGGASTEMMDAVTDVTLQDAGYGGYSFGKSFEGVRDWLLLGKGPKTLRIISQDDPARPERNTEKSEKGLNVESFKARIGELKKDKKLTHELTVVAGPKAKLPKHVKGTVLEQQIDILGPDGTQGTVYVLRQDGDHWGVRKASTPENIKAGPHAIGFGLDKPEEETKTAPESKGAMNESSVEGGVTNVAALIADDKDDDHDDAVAETPPKPKAAEPEKKAEAPKQADQKAKTPKKGKKEKKPSGPKVDAYGNLSERIDPSQYQPEGNDRVFTNEFTVVGKAALMDKGGKKTGEVLPVGTKVLVYKADHLMVQVATVDPAANPAVKQTDDRWVKFASLGGKGEDVGLGNEETDAEDKARADKMRDGLPPGRNPGKSAFGWGFGGGFEPELDGIALASSLMSKVHQLMEWAIHNDMVTDNITITSGMRSPSKAHKLGTSYEIQNMEKRGNVTLASLKALPGGKDKDGNLWYQEGWDTEDIKKNAKRYKSGTAVAAGGYAKGDPRRLPIAGPQPGVSRHCTGHAVDVKIPWKDKAGKGTDVWGWEHIYHQFGLTRPLHKDLVSGTLQEYWHIEETGKKIVGADNDTDDVED